MASNGFTDCNIEVRDLDKVGLVKETKPVIIALPDNISGWAEKAAATKLLKEKEDCGWTISTYLGSQDSFFSKDGKRYVKSIASRWVPKVDPVETE